MAAIFPAWSNAAFAVVVVMVMVGTCGAIAAPMIWVRTPYATGEGVPVPQPVMFDHRHHVTDDAIDCLYCHEQAERSRYAGVPATEVCMGCHAQVWIGSPLVEPVRKSFFEATPIRWRRVNRMPDFVYFDHAAHTTRGVKCATCHGQVETMAMVAQAVPLTMGWCLDCHRSRGAPTDCSTCHR